MRERELLLQLCDRISAHIGRDVIPETWRDGCVSVFLSGGGGCVRSYVCGGGVFELPIDVKIRQVVRCEADRLRVIETLSDIGEITELPMGENGSVAEVCRVGAPKKKAVYENGSEEYVLPLMIRYTEAGK